MGLSQEKKMAVIAVIKQSIQEKLAKYKPETKYMPFHYRLLGKDRLALFSFIQSLNTTFGTSIYEPVAIALAEGNFKVARRQAKPHSEISQAAQKEIQAILNALVTATAETDKPSEVERLRPLCLTGEMDTVKLANVDIWLEGFDDTLYMIDLKTVKPNKSNFIDFKRMLLEWTAVELARTPHRKIETSLGLPYNPYHPDPYARWTMRGMFDLSHEVKVAEDLWDFIGGEGAYQDLLDCFEQAGIELRELLDAYFANFRS